MERQMSKRNYFLKTLTILFLSILLLLPTLMLEGKETKAAAVTETRAVDLSKGNVTISENNAVVRVYQSVGGEISNSIDVSPNIKVTIILDNLNINQRPPNVSPVRIQENSTVTLLLKGNNKILYNDEGCSGVYFRDGVACTIADYGNGDGILDVSNGGASFKHVVLGASAQGHAALTINSGTVKATTKGYGPAIGATAGNDKAGGSTLDLVINGGTVEAKSEGWGAAIGTQGDVPRNQENTVNVTINGGKVIGSNPSKDTGNVSGKARCGAVIGTGYAGYSKQNVTLNIPKTSTAELELSSTLGGAAIGGSGCWNSGEGQTNTNQETHENIVANIAGGNTTIFADGQAAGIGIGAGMEVDQKVEVNISGGNINIANTSATINSQGPGIGVGIFSKNAVLDCNISGGNINVLSKDHNNTKVNAPAIGIAAKAKNNTITKLDNSSGNTFNLNVTGGTINAETRSSDTTIPDIGSIVNNAFNVKVDGGSLNAVNQRMDVRAKNSQNQNVYPAAIKLGGITEEKTAVESASVNGKNYGKDLIAQFGKLYLWTTPGNNKAITANVKGDSRAYSNPAVNLVYNSGFTFTDPDVALKKTITPEELGSFNIKNVGDNSVTVQVGGATSDVSVLLQAYEHGTSRAVGEAQTYEAGKTEYTFSRLTKNKLYDIKISEDDFYWPAEKEALVVKPFEYAPTLPNAKLKLAYEASVAAEGGTFTYALTSGSTLPAGLTLNSNGTISGTPTQVGDFSVNIIATATDDGISANNSRTASVAIKVEPIKVALSVVDLAGQPLNCACELTSTAASGGVAVGDIVLFTLTPCPLHDFVKFNLNGDDVQAVPGANKKYTYSYVVKASDSELNMKAFMTESEKRITKIERVGDEKELAIYANDPKNESLAQLKTFVNDSITLKATYNDSTEKTGKATDLDLAWATNSTYSPKGGTYEYSVSAEGTSVEQAVTVNRVSAELGTLNDMVRTVSEEGYPTIAALGLPETIACSYQAGVPVDPADRELAISWTTEVPENFGKTATEAPVVFEGNAAVPGWATIENNAVSVNVSISDRVVLAPVVTIEDKIYDGTKTASFKDTPALNPEDLTQGTDVQLSGVPVAEFSSADAGNNIPVTVSGLSLSGTDAGKYVLDLNNVTGNINPAPITLTGISMEDKTVTEDGNGQTIDIKGDLPSDVTVSYSYLKDGESQASDTAPTKAGSYTVTATFKADANHVVVPETMSAKLVIEEKGIKVSLTVVDQADQPLSCACELTSTAANGSAAVGDTVSFTLTPCPLHNFVKFNLNGTDVKAADVSEANGKFTYAYVVKETDSELNMKAVMAESEKRITKIERVGAEKELAIYANDQRNESLDQLKAFVNNSITLKATYNDSTEKTGKATDLGLAWATNSTYSPKGGTYEYSVSAEGTSVEQAVTVNRVSAELGTLNDMVRTVSEEGYPTIAALGLPETIACSYQAGVPVDPADRELAISWTTEVPENFGKTATEVPVMFEGSAAVPEWATVENNVVSVNVSISDRVVLAPAVTIEDKIYDGTKAAVVKDSPVLNPEDLTQGTDVQLSGTPVAEFSSANAGNNIPVKVSGLSLSGADADKYILDLSNAVGNITPATITLIGISMEDKTVTEDGSGQTIDIEGDLPSGVTVSYSYLKDGESQASSTAPTNAGSYTITAAFKTDANHVVEPETMSAKLVIEEKSTAVVVEEIKTDLTGEQAGGMSATVLKNGEAVQVGDSVVAGDKLTYQFEPKAVREAYVPYAFTMNGETVEVTKLAEGKGYSAEYTVKEGDTALKADAKCVLLGNFSGDDKINIIDAQKIAQAAAAGEAIENMQKTAGDVNFDGKINIIDAQKIAQYAADTSSVF